MGMYVRGGGGGAPCQLKRQDGGLNRGTNMPSNGRGRNCTGGLEATHRYGGRRLSQGVVRLIGQGLSGQELPDGLGGGEQVGQGQEGLEGREGRKTCESRGGEGAGKSPLLKLQ